MDIEEVPPRVRKRSSKCRSILSGPASLPRAPVGLWLNLEPELIKPFSAMVTNLYKLFSSYDCSLLEINPW